MSKEILIQLNDLVKQKNDARIVALLQDVHPADITAMLYDFETADCQYIISLVTPALGAQIISLLDSETRKKFIAEAYEARDFVAFVPELDSDDAVDILNEQPVKFREEVIALLEDREMADYIIELLRYDEDCAGGLMAKELIKANHKWTVIQTIEEIRRQAENVEKIYSVYVVDNQDKLLGRVSLKKIILSKAATRIEEIFEPEIVYIESFRAVDEVADIMQKYDLESVPVVNIQGKLLGRITIDDVVDVITDKAEMDQNLMSGISQPVEEDDTLLQSAKARLPWLLIGMVGGLLGARFAGFFEQDIRLIPAMAFFIPLITATGGNVGIQSSTVMVQSIANKSFIVQDIPYKIFRVLLLALVNASIISICVFAFNFVFMEAGELAWVVSSAIFAVVILASFLGTFTPLVMEKMKINPALASGPFITTANDLLGLAVYFSVARLLIR